MEKKEIEGRIRHLECLLNNAKEDGKQGMVIYYQVMIGELVVAFHGLGVAFAIAYVGLI